MSSFLTCQNFYFLGCKPGHLQVTHSRFGIIWIVNDPNDFIGWIVDEIRRFVSARHRSCRRLVGFVLPCRFYVVLLVVHRSNSPPAGYQPQPYRSSAYQDEDIDRPRTRPMDITDCSIGVATAV